MNEADWKKIDGRYIRCMVAVPLPSVRCRLLSLISQQVFEFLLELLDLRPDHHRAVALVRVTLKVFLVILFGREERIEGRNLSHDGRLKRLRCIELPLVLFCSLALLVVVVENR
jgi:hypothetical protein